MEQSKRAPAFVLIIVVLVGGCVQGSATDSHELKIYVDPLPHGLDARYSNVMEDAMLFWRNQGFSFEKVSTEREADVIVGWVKEFGGQTAGHTIYSDFVEIGLGNSLCQGEWKPYTYDSVLQIATHELGHVLGQEHVDDPHHIMYPITSTKYEYEMDNSDILPNDAIAFFPLCTRNEVATYSIEITSTEDLNVWVVKSADEFNNMRTRAYYSPRYYCWGHTEYSEYVTQYPKTCTVNKGAGIVLQHSSRIIGEGTVGSSATYTIRVKEL